MPCDALEFQDSEISSLETRSGQLVVRFSAACVHRSEGGFGRGAEVGFLPALELCCLRPMTVSQDAGCLGRLSGGRLVVDGAELARVPLPYESGAEMVLELTFANGAHCRVLGTGLSVRSTEAPRWAEWLRC